MSDQIKSDIESGNTPVRPLKGLGTYVNQNVTLTNEEKNQVWNDFIEATNERADFMGDDYDKFIEKNSTPSPEQKKE